jgi:Heparinase II/III-like protein
VLNAEELSARRAAIESEPELRALRDRLVQRAGPVLTRMPPVPQSKALLTADGGVCPNDGTRLLFDPWSPTVHRCSHCGREFSGERHDRAWAHYQHLWLAERAAHLATVAVAAGRDDAATRTNQLLQAYRGYHEYPNQDNVLGPSRLFFSTYLESIWIANYLAAATLMREAGLLSDESGEIVSRVADEAANLIGEYDEGFSNRQTWHNAALASIAVWFEDGDLAARAIQGQTGILAHLLHGFGEDGMWYEGDNYHLFALRGQLLAMGWARQAGVDLMDDPRLAARVAAALRAPALTALPDFTFPARKDSRFGVSLAQPMYLELWEIGLARLGRGANQQEDLWSWLRRLYQSPAPPAQTFDSYLHEAGEPLPAHPRSRADLSWWSLLEMVPAIPSETPPWSPGSVFVEGQGLALLRSGDRYAGLECGAYGGGHGHPDRLNLVLHAGGEYWLPDFGTGSYVARDLFWYRSTLAHNAPRLDGISQPMGDAFCENFDQNGAWAWARGSYGDLSRTLVAGPDYLLDVVQLSAPEDHVLELPLHLSGRVEVKPAGSWEAAELPDEFARQAERYRPVGSDGIVLHACGPSGATLSAYLAYQGDLLRALSPGAPGSTEPVPFYLVRSRGQNLRIITVLEPGSGRPVIRGVLAMDNTIEVETESGVDHHVATVEGWEVQSPDGVTGLRGVRRQPKPFEPLVQRDRPLVAQGVALPIAEPPALDGSMEGFDSPEPLRLDHEDQYRRSEEPYAGPDDFSATAFINWSDEALYLAVEVVKPEVVARDPAAPPLRLDNEPDEIHADGIQVYVRLPLDGAVYGYLVVPSTDEGGVIARAVSGAPLRQGEVRGGWEPTESGYRLTVAIAPAQWGPFRPGDEIGFDLLVNQMLPDRMRRAGQLVWSGGGGWVWLRGDRQDPSRFGTLELR